MFSSRRARLAWVAITALLVATLSAAPAQALGAGSGPSYYLSLGDSLAFGYQPNLVDRKDFNPTHYRSYAEDYASLARSLKLVNYGCPGETTSTLINGGCPWLPLPLHDSYPAGDSQLGAAEALLQAHGAQTKLVTIDIGSNDLLALVNGCAADLTCVGAGLQTTLGTIETNYAQIVGTVRALAPNARIVIFNLYNPLALSVPGSDQLLTQYVNPALAGFASAEHVQLADAFAAINGVAGSTQEKIRVCLLTWECTSYANIHPTTLGYWSLTVALVKATR